MTTADLVAFLKKYPTGFLCGLISVVCGVLLYLHSGDIEASQAEYDARAAEAAKMTENIRNSANLPEQVAEIQGYTKELESRLMKASQLAINLQYFYKMEAESGIKLVDVTQGGFSRLPKGLYGGIAFTVTIQGPYVQAMKFLARLENARHFCRINSAAISKMQVTAPGATDVTVAMNLEILGQP